MERHLKRSPRRAIASLAAVLAAGTITGAVVPDAHAADGFELTRVAGANRYATAASLATTAFPSGSDVAVLATGENYADALAGSFLAGRFGDGAPILLTTRDALPSETSAALDDLEATTVYILGGTAAVSQAVEDALGDRTVVRVAGANRYETAADIATLEAEGAAAPGELSGDPTVIVASGEGFADALASGPLAFAGNLPVLLTPAGELSDAASAAIDELGSDRAVVVGGTAAVSAAVVDEIEGKGLTVQRVAGANRYATAVAVANLGRTGLGLSSSSVDLASGENFPDALAAGPASGVANRPLLLTASDELSGETEDYLVDHSGTLTQGRVFGGSAAISETAVNQAEAAGGSGETIGATRVVAVDKANDHYTYVQDGTDEAVEIHYASDDDFTVDGKAADIAGFEANLTVGDIIVVDDPEAPTQHDLSNVSAAQITSGMVGNVDLENDQLDIIDPVTGNAFRSNITYSGTFRTDSGAADMAAFEADVNEGDTIEISGGFNLTNETAEGIATDVDIPQVPVDARFRIDDALGDIPASADNDLQDNDGTYHADCSPAGSGQAFTVDGNAQATCDDFVGALSEGDTVSYARADGVERFTLVNQAGTADGLAIDDLASDGDGNGNGETPLSEPDDSDGGSFSVVQDGEVVSVTYTDGGAFVVDGVTTDEAHFEAAYTAGDVIAFAAAESGSAQRLELTNEDLTGEIGTVNTNDTPRPDLVHDTTGNADAPHSYGVLATGTNIELAQVSYTPEDTNTYFINDASRGLSPFESALAAANDETADDDATITRVLPANADGDTQHRLEDSTPGE